MAKEDLLTAQDIADELELGKATTTFLLKRFKNAIPETLIDGQPHYPKTIIHTLFSIQGQLEMGILPADIEKQLSMDSIKNASSSSKNTLSGLASGDDIRLSKDGLEVLKTVFSEIGEQQRRIAIAHEKRAVAEERKAVAIEKRAEAEEKKADAMNNIAHALQEMNRMRDLDPHTQQIAREAAGMITADEQDLQLENGNDNGLAADAHTADLDVDMDGEADLLNDEFNTDIDLDDLIEAAETEDILSDTQEISEVDDLSSLLDEPFDDIDDLEDQAADIDDLSALLNDTDLAPMEFENDTFLDDTLTGDTLPELSVEDIDDAVDLDDLDDLARLLDEPLNGTDQDTESHAQVDLGPLDDLSKLIEPEQVEGDDLYALIDGEANTEQETKLQPELDDLSRLIEPDETVDTAPPEPVEMDDLSLLIDTRDALQQQQSDDKAAAPLDDLSKLIEPVESSEPAKNDEPDIKLDVSPQDDIEKYKAAVMQLILGFKQEGLTVDQATDKLNANQIKTLSGKPEWGRKAISQIYKFIDAAN